MTSDLDLAFQWVPQILIQPTSAWTRLATKHNDSIIRYFAGVYLVQFLIAVMDNSEDGELTVLQTKNLQHAASLLIEVMENRKKELLSSEEVVAFSANETSLFIGEQEEQESSQFEELDNASQISYTSSKKATTNTFLAKEVVSNEFLSSNYLIDQAMSSIEVCVEQIDDNHASKKTGLELIDSSYLLKIASKLFPDIEFKSEPELTLANIETLYDGASPLVNQRILPSSELKDKIKYSKLLGVIVVKKFKHQGKLDITDHDLVINLIRLKERVSPKMIDDTIKNALETEDAELEDGKSEDIDEVNDFGFPEIPGNERSSNDEKSTKNVESAKALGATKVDTKAETKAETSSESPEKKQVVEDVKEPALPVEQLMENSELFDQATRSCKYAMSAIEFEDVSTAISNLRESLRLLEKFQCRNQ